MECKWGGNGVEMEWASSGLNGIGLEITESNSNKCLIYSKMQIKPFYLMSLDFFINNLFNYLSA
jgi:hypothetical protein